MGVLFYNKSKGKLGVGNPTGDVGAARAEFSFEPDMLYFQF